MVVKPVTGDSVRNRRRVVLVAVLIALLVVSGGAAVAVNRAGSSQPVLSDRVDVVSAQMPIAFPVNTPPGDLFDVTLTDIDARYALLTFYKLNEGSVVVCTGDAAGCRDRTGNGPVFRQSRVDGHDVLVTGHPPEDDGSRLSLTGADAAFWQDVPFTQERPSWVSNY